MFALLIPCSPASNRGALNSYMTLPPCTLPLYFGQPYQRASRRLKLSSLLRELLQSYPCPLCQAWVLVGWNQANLFKLEKTDGKGITKRDLRKLALLGLVDELGSFAPIEVLAARKAIYIIVTVIRSLE